MLNFVVYGTIFKFFCAVLISRLDLMDNYLALILSAFIRNGLLEVGVINLTLFYFIYFIFSNRILSEQQTYDT